MNFNIVGLLLGLLTLGWVIALKRKNRLRPEMFWINAIVLPLTAFLLWSSPQIIYNALVSGMSAPPLTPEMPLFHLLRGFGMGFVIVWSLFLVRPAEPRPAGFWIRVVASVIDGATLSLIAVQLAWVLNAVFSGEITSSSISAGNSESARSQIIELSAYLIACVPYYVWGQKKYAATLGKAALGIRVTRGMSWGQAWTRFFCYLPSYLILGAGFIMVAFHPKKRGFHELLSGTESTRV